MGPQRPAAAHSPGVGGVGARLAHVGDAGGDRQREGAAGQARARDEPRAPGEDHAGAYGDHCRRRRDGLECALRESCAHRLICEMASGAPWYMCGANLAVVCGGVTRGLESLGDRTTRSVTRIAILAVRASRGATTTRPE